jgi:hypothetical protein
MRKSFRIDLHVNFFGFRQHCDSNRRSVNSSAGFGLRHALHAMTPDSCFNFE